MTDYQLAKLIVILYPYIKIQLASGYSDNRYTEAGNDNQHKTLLHKYYSSFTLISRMSQLLAGTQNE